MTIMKTSFDSTQHGTGRAIASAASALVGVSLALALLGAPSVHAQQPESESWKVRLTAMGHIPQVYGRTQFPGGRSGPGISISPRTVLDKINFGVSGQLHAQKGPWGIFSQLRYSDLSDHRGGTHNFSIPGVEVPGHVTGNFRLRDKMTTFTLAGTWQAVAKPQSEMHLLAGTRMLRDKQRISWKLSHDVSGIAREGASRTRTTNWDAIVGLMGRARLGAGPWFLPYYLDVGTGDSRVTAQAAVGVGYQLSWGELSASWRYLGYRNKSGHALRRLNFNGPSLDLTFVF